ncbi:MAG: acylphosphatase [Nitrospirae bacterium RIFCSPHIGHO2_02_FULL_42_12]|nr:MAG: acylphosphatase [Nitrospirae bacterium RIFCSPHIGHO2_02_FULL_42_12]
MKVRVHFFISGRVQGVFFRDSTRQMASIMGLTGYVKNMIDGRVEVVAEGEKGAVDKLTQWCYTGPPDAIVDSVEIHNEPYKKEFEKFEIRR